MRYLINFWCMFCTIFLIDGIGMCALLNSSMIFVCMASLTLAIITLRGVEFPTLCTYLFIFGLDGWVDIFVTCVGRFYYWYREVKCGN